MTGRALITGAAGQDGRYLADLLLGQGYEVFAVLGPETGDDRSWVDSMGAGYQTIEADITDTASLVDALKVAAPSEIYNLAGMSSVGDSWRSAVLVAEVNAVGVVRLLEALLAVRPHARLLQASSADIFGIPLRSPQSEQTEVSPVSPYGASKAYAHFMTRSYRQVRGLFACNAILYNHESPLRPPSFVVRKITQGVARISLGLQDELRLGNLDVRRDWGFAGDYVRAMWMMLQADSPDDYIIASGASHTVRELCEVAFRRVGLDYQDHVVVDPAFFRPAEAAEQAGDSSKARAVLGWEPEVSFAELVHMMVDADLEELKAGSA